MGSRHGRAGGPRVATAVVLGLLTAALVSGCQPPGLTIGNGTSTTVRVVEETTDLELVPRIVPGSTVSLRVAAMDADGCAVSWRLVAIAEDGRVVAALDGPCPGTWKIREARR
ncbi:hypothetical protein [Phycicoccus sonneratiae]|uniref:Uncharacterized protein n=1 Tax=Phycicoccus sonneratiae TaxID=2807628 RepID=A0ABS2CJ91_9MICO|nr:hypothetical protein [Phycicoccus sonneraticus]MBM6399951.1 hypothetical protein [Phycicoccus sonneraticus]